MMASPPTKLGTTITTQRNPSQNVLDVGMGQVLCRTSMADDWRFADGERWDGVNGYMSRIGLAQGLVHCAHESEPMRGDIQWGSPR